MISTISHSALTSKGQTTVPARVREALHLKAGDRILYEIEGDTVVIRPHPGAMAVFGPLRPPVGKADVLLKDARLAAEERRLKQMSKEGRK
jgi:antitoxin PrlF